MAKQGADKQVPPEQRGRGMNPEHKEGQDNAKNQQRQAASPPPPAKKGGKA